MVVVVIIATNRSTIFFPTSHDNALRRFAMGRAARQDNISHKTLFSLHF
jgi:hypothetical protein